MYDTLHIMCEEQRDIADNSVVLWQLKSCSMIYGFLNPLFSHQFRYGGGKLLDASG
jgi:hypothetical protein